MVVSCSSANPSRENLLKFPHLAAIQHNNCMYLAHHLLTLGHHFRTHLPEPHSEGIATFVDMVPGFKKLGELTFLQLSTTLTWNLVQKLISKTADMILLIQVTIYFADLTGLSVGQYFHLYMQINKIVGLPWSTLSTLLWFSSRCPVLLNTDERPESRTVGETFHRSQLLQPGRWRQLHCSQQGSQTGGRTRHENKM